MKTRYLGIISILILVMSHFANGATEIVLYGEKTTYRINTESLSVVGITSNQKHIPVTDGFFPQSTTILDQSDTCLSISCATPDLQVDFEIIKQGIAISVTSEQKQSIVWPVYEVPENSDLLWLFGGGRCLPMSDQRWVEYLNGEHAVIEYPFWGHLHRGFTTSWVFETPFRSSMLIEGRDFSITQKFLTRKGDEMHRFQFSVTNSRNILYPAKCYRSYLKSSGQFKTAKQKFEELPLGSRDKLLGGIHVYIWGYGRISEVDINPNKWNELAHALMSHSIWEDKIKDLLSTDSKAAIKALSKHDDAYAYLKIMFLAALNEILKTIPAEQIYACFSEGFQFSPDKWGQGISTQMITDLKDAGIDRARLVTDGMEDVERLQIASEAALDAGYLFGVYDSYSSIHPESTAGTDSSWSTAQFNQQLYETAAIQRENGSFYTGFNHIGRLLNPVAASTVMRKRVTDNLDQVAMNSYFIDCDGCSGDIYEDYNPLFLTTAEEMAEARKDRLRWLREEKGLIVGTEGTDPSILQEVLVAEWAVSPPFFWEDSDFRNPKSKYFIGKFWPSYAPGINFKTIPLKEKFIHRYFDPRTRIPLLQAVIHDSVLTTNHWNSDNFKYEETEDITALIQFLYLSPPLYNLNRKRFHEKKDMIQHYYSSFQPLHSKYGFDALISFQWLSDDRLVQEVEYSSGLRIVANFANRTFAHDQNLVNPKSMIAYLPDGEILIFEPNSSK